MGKKVGGGLKNDLTPLPRIYYRLPVMLAILVPLAPLCCTFRYVRGAGGTDKHTDRQTIVTPGLSYATANL